MAKKQNDAIKKKIMDGIRTLAAAAGKSYICNVAELSRTIGVSRPTLYSYRSVVDEVLDELKANKKPPKGQAVIEFMRERMARLEEEKGQLKKELDVLRNHHARIYEILYYKSANLALLIKSVAAAESKEAGRCILCHRVVEQDIFLGSERNVVKLAPKEKE